MSSQHHAAVDLLLELRPPASWETARLPDAEVLAFRALRLRNRRHIPRRLAVLAAMAAGAQQLAVLGCEGRALVDDQGLGDDVVDLPRAALEHAAAAFTADLA